MAGPRFIVDDVIVRPEDQIEYSEWANKLEADPNNPVPLPVALTAGEWGMVLATIRASMLEGHKRPPLQRILHDRIYEQLPIAERNS